MQSTRQEQGAILSQYQVEQYHEKGYVVVQRFFGPDDMTDLHAEMERVSAGQTLPGTMPRASRWNLISRPRAHW